MSTARRDTLVTIEKAAQAYWEQHRLHEMDAPPAHDPVKPPKHFTTFPFPYMNGRLHLGHGFSLTKAEFVSRYKRMKGFRSLWPFGFHVTGTPIAACAQKIMKEMEQYGNPPVFPEMSPVVEEAKSPKELGDLLKFKSKRAKVGPAKPQWEIMQSMGIPDDEIPKFSDTQQWLNFFPPIAIADLRRFGCYIDFRRSFITTMKNPYFDRFVSWQFRQLRRAGLVNFGKRYCVYSPMDGQPCADHDRASGEGVLPQEYTIVKLPVQDPLEQAAFKPFKNHIGGRAIILPAATLRAETVIGLTNCWVSPKILYRAYAMLNERSNEEEIVILTPHSARNMAYQGFIFNGKKWQTPEPLFEVNGEHLIGIPLSSPMAVYTTIYTLPMSTIIETKGTGIVMSVPSDSPDDYINLSQLRNKPEYRKKLGLEDAWVMPFPPIPIIDVPDLGTMCAKTMCEKLKINGPNAAELLDEAKRVCYQMGFYQGVMIAGPYKGMKVSEAKQLTQDWIDKRGECMRYCEPIRQVISRSGDECVVALCNEWYIEYGQPQWKKAVMQHLEKMNMFYPGVRNGFVEVLNWLSDWPCSRTFGLGTYLPCDESHTMIIDSLSDSTIYMAYYTISRFLHTNTNGSLELSGSVDNEFGLKPEMFTDDIFDYIYHGVGDAASLSSDVGMPLRSLELMRNEFEYFYPVDIRCSAKDLIQNHLTMFLYNHAAIWPNDESKWPRAIFCNGHIQVDNEKMAKSKGNFISLGEALDTYGADPTRLACADAGDTLEDANFVRDTAASFILKLTTLLDQAQEQLSSDEVMRKGDFNVFDKIFNNTMNTITTATEGYYESMQFRMVLNTAFHELMNEFSQYRLNCGDDLIHSSLVRRYYELLTLMMMPLAPHFCEHMWRNVLKKEGTVIDQRFPSPDAPLDYSLIVKNRVMMNVVKDIRSQVVKSEKQKKKQISSAVIYTLSVYSDWQVNALTQIQTIYKENDNSFPADIAKQIINSSSESLPKNLIPDTMAFISFVRANVEKYGEQAMSLMPIVNDFDLLSNVSDNVRKLSGVNNIMVKHATDESCSGHAAARRKCRPGEPSIAFIFSE
ncbi:unnamed protein product [Phytomonas sp. Hart1]|nr:unnamed protein product [Phytomonas sp. Hart1]|eukprot:CCW66784.1 unnamed protein product [Phytomonas sp. isolate Hart1]